MRGLAWLSRSCSLVPRESTYAGGSCGFHVRLHAICLNSQRFGWKAAAMANSPKAPTAGCTPAASVAAVCQGRGDSGA